MAKSVIVLGTTYAIQAGECAEPGVAEGFQELLGALCVVYALAAIGEGLGTQPGTLTPAFEAARHACVEHIYCDSAARHAEILVSHSRDMGRTQGEEVPLGAGPAAHAHWAERIHAFDRWPLLFVCEAEHVSAFSALLAGQGLQVSRLPDFMEML